MRGYREEGQNQVTMDSFKVHVALKVRADGPTKVLEIVEEEAFGRDKDKDKDKEKEGKEKEKDDGEAGLVDKGEKKEASSATLQSISENDPSDAEASKAAAPLASASTNPNPVTNTKKPTAYDELEDSRQALVSVSIVLQSVALSIMDSEPGEVMYLALRDIEISIERSRQRVKVSER